MAPKKKTSRRRVQRRAVPEHCYFCHQKKAPSYKEHEELVQFVSDRAKIVGKRRSGLCAKHQRRITMEIKRARHLGLLPFKASI